MGCVQSDIARVHTQRPPAGHGIAGIHRQIDDHLLNLYGVSINVPCCANHIQLENHILRQ